VDGVLQAHSDIFHYVDSDAFYLGVCAISHRTAAQIRGRGGPVVSWIRHAHRLLALPIHGAFSRLIRAIYLVAGLSQGWRRALQRICAQMGRNLLHAVLNRNGRVVRG